MMKRFIKKTPLYAAYRRLSLAARTRRGRTTYAQCGEDVIMGFLCSRLGIRNPYYVDIGANDPVALSNTYLFYKNGARGVLVEPDPILCERLARVRKGDACINAGVGRGGADSATFYRMSPHTLSTFSEKDARELDKSGVHRIVETIRVPMITMDSLFEERLERDPDILSLDIEGETLEILRTLDFRRHRPKVLCIETLTYAENGSERKIDEIISFVEKQGYVVYADTYINTIFVDEKIWSA